MVENILHFPTRSDFGVKEENCSVALLKYLKKHGDKICQIDSTTDEKQTFNQLLMKSIRTAQHLQKKGLTRDDVVLLCAYNSLNSSAPLLACLYLGIKLCPIDPLVTQDDCWHFLNLVKPKMVFCESECADLMKKTLNKLGLMSEIVIFGDKSGFSSFNDYLRPTGREHLFVPEEVDKDDCCFICCSSGTTGLPKGAMLTHRGMLSKYKNPEVHDNPELVVFGVTSFGWFSGIYIFMFTIFLGHSQILARKLPGDTLFQIIEKYKVVDLETRKPVGPNIPGEICIETNGIFKGYYNDPKSTVIAVDKDGFFLTGDIGYYDEDRCFYVVDRIKDIFRSQGWPISPAELESILLTHPAVIEAAVIGYPHEQDGERPMGIVVLKKGSTATEEEILRFYNDQVSERKKLKAGLKFVDSLPFNTSGKLRRKYLREQVLLKNKNKLLSKI